MFDDKPVKHKPSSNAFRIITSDNLIARMYFTYFNLSTHIHRRLYIEIKDYNTSYNCKVHVIEQLKEEIECM